MNVMDMQGQIAQVAQYFYRTFNVTGAADLEFGTQRRVPDSDGESVIDVYLYPRSPECSHLISQENPRLHLQVLNEGLNASLFGYVYRIQVDEVPNTESPDISLIERRLASNRPTTAWADASR